MIYLDNAATTRVCGEAIEKISDALSSRFGNPSSLYSLGFEAEKELTAARSAVAKSLGCATGEVYFTSSGTESNNLGVLGSARARRGWGSKVVITGFEHPSVDNAARALEREGFEVVRIAPSPDGSVDAGAVVSAVDKTTALVAVMRVNNETGALVDAEAIARGVKEINGRAAVHCDDVQGFLKHETKTALFDTLSISGHKLHAPKGIAALYVRKGFNIEPVLYGGHQEKGLRPGTENVAYASGLAAAIAASGDVKRNLERAGGLNRRLRTGLTEFENAVINSPDGASPYILNFSFTGYRSETLLHFLEQKEIYVSSGSACSKGERSRTLEAMGLSDARIDSAVRVSFSADNAEADVDALLAALSEARRTLAKAQVTGR